MVKILSYTIECKADPESFQIPVYAKFLGFGLVGNDLKMWFEANPEIKTIERKFKVYGTGDEITIESWRRTPRNIASFSFNEMAWHLYEYPTQDEK